MSKEYTYYTVDKIMNTPLIDTDKMFVMNVTEFMHPELYANVMEEVQALTDWRAPEITGRKNYHIGPDQQHPHWIQIARDTTWKNELVNDAIQSRFDLHEDIILGEPLMWQDDNTNGISDVHVDSPAYYYTYQHCLATDNEFAHTGTRFWEVDCEYNQTSQNIVSWSREKMNGRNWNTDENK